MNIKKHLIATGIAVLLLVVGLSGCNENNTPSNNGENKFYLY